MKKTLLSLMAAASLTLAVPAIADVTLPAPQQAGGLGVFSALKARRSVTKEEYPLANVSMQELSNLLWAASGKNRDKHGWTVPLARHSEPYVTIYAVGKSGVYRYDWKTHTLVEKHKHDERGSLGHQPFVEKTPVVLVFVANKKTPSENAFIAAGSMTQNAYLAAAAMGINVRFIRHMKDQGEIAKALGLGTGDYALNLLLVGKKEGAKAPVEAGSGSAPVTIAPNVVTGNPAKSGPALAPSIGFGLFSI